MSEPTARSTVLQARRLVVKIGSSSLTTSDGDIAVDRVRALVDTLATLRARGQEVVLVSSGAIATGLGPLGLSRRPTDLATQQAAASVGQGLLIGHYIDRFGRHGQRVGQVLLTVDDLTRRSHYRNAHQTLATLLGLGVIPIVNENDTVATHEIRFGDNDRLAALVAHLVRADLLVLLSDVDALHTAPPGRPGAQPIAMVNSPDDLRGLDLGGPGSGVGTGGMATKIEAARIATGAGIAALLTSAGLADAALRGEAVGTWFAATGKRRPTRLLWLAHATEAAGSLWLDPGAVRAVTERHASLLAAGITRIEGAFTSGEPVNLLDPQGSLVARGLVSFDADELPGLLGRRTEELAAERGAGYDRAVVHRDVLILL